MAITVTYPSWLAMYRRLHVLALVGDCGVGEARRSGVGGECGCGCEGFDELSYLDQLPGVLIESMVFV